MPFKSKAQQGYLFAKKPKIAKEFASHTSKEDYKEMPEHVDHKKIMSQMISRSKK